ncbi:MAG: RtcB family protein [Patescibacteria group bacterium]|nr:RtcB family protein [Patescibacteria group bacterium]
MEINDLRKISDYLWEIPQSYDGRMRVPARVYASSKMLEEIVGDESLQQLVNVAMLPGIQKYALAMPDIHEGYGFPIGGVAAFDLKDGIISPGGIGYDINCGVRLLRSNLGAEDAKPRLRELGRAIYAKVPSGVGRGGKIIFSGEEFDKILENGARRIVELGYGVAADLENTESGGKLDRASAGLVSKEAKDRGRDQLGTMGAGNHFVEVEYVSDIFDNEIARRLGLFQNQAVVLIHTGSRGLGHQIATDYVRLMMRVMGNYGIKLPDRELACVPFAAEEGQQYFQAMAAGANFAWANRQIITYEVRQAWQEVFQGSGGELALVYDVAHNIAKIENDLLVHRKGATRAFPGQTVLIPGSMGAGSYVLLGEEKSMEESFGSTCHGAGRRMSRSRAKKEIGGRKLKEELEKKGIVVESGSFSGLAEEAPFAYKNVDEVVGVVADAGIARKIARLKPLVVIKG